MNLKNRVLVLSVMVVFYLFGVSFGSDKSLGSESYADMCKKMELFRLWASGCSHVDTDLKKGRESLGEAIRQSEGYNGDGSPPFDWDIALHCGDWSGCQEYPGDDSGREVVRQLSCARKHRREQFYGLCGNHDASGPDEPCQWWFQKWVDPLGQNTEISGVDPNRRPYPIEGTWERYSFRVGNILFLIISDRNDGGPPVGRGKHGGYPAGAVTTQIFQWWKKMVEENQNCIIISVHHHMLKETTVGSGPWEGFVKDREGKYKSKYHGYFEDGSPEGASYLYFLDDKPDAQAFEKYLQGHPGAIDFWIGGHTHTHPDDKINGRTHIERKWGVAFVNAAALSRYHSVVEVPPISRLFEFIPGSKSVKISCYLHDDSHAKRGWYKPAERTMELNKSFSWSISEKE